MTCPVPTAANKNTTRLSPRLCDPTVTTSCISLPLDCNERKAEVEAGGGRGCRRTSAFSVLGPPPPNSSISLRRTVYSPASGSPVIVKSRCSSWDSSAFHTPRSGPSPSGLRGLPRRPLEPGSYPPGPGTAEPRAAQWLMAMPSSPLFLKIISEAKQSTGFPSSSPRSHAFM